MKLVFCVFNKPDDAVYHFIQKKRAEGKACKEAMIAGFNKFLRIYYARVSAAYNAITVEKILIVKFFSYINAFQRSGGYHPPLC